MYKLILINLKVLIASIIAIILAAMIPAVVQSPYYLELLIIIIVNSILAMTFVMMLKTGLISLCISSFFGLGAYTAAILTTKLGMSFWICLPASFLIVGIIGIGLGYILIGSGISGFSFVILSSVVGMLFPVIMGNFSYVNGYLGIKIPPPEPLRIPMLAPLEFISEIQFYYLALVLLILVVIICMVFYRSRVGRAWTAIGMSPGLSASIGIDVFKYKLTAFVLASSICGLIGCFYGQYRGYIRPDTFDMWVNIHIHVHAILGGIGHAILGPLMGSLLMTIFPESIRMTKEFSYFFTGGLLILLILFLPEGLLSLLDKQKTISGWKNNRRRILSFFIRH